MFQSVAHGCGGPWLHQDVSELRRPLKLEASEEAEGSKPIRQGGHAPLYVGVAWPKGPAPGAAHAVHPDPLFQEPLLKPLRPLSDGRRFLALWLALMMTEAPLTSLYFRFSSPRKCS